MNKLSIIDIIIIIQILSGLIVAYKRGFIRQVLGIANVIISFILAKIFSVPFAQWLYIQLNIDRKLYNIANNILGSELSGNKLIVNQEVLNELTRRLNSLSSIDITNTIESSSKLLQEQFKVGKVLTADKAIAGLVLVIKPIVMLALTLISLMILYTLFTLLFSIVINSLKNIINTFTLTRMMDHNLGLVFGLVKDLLILYIIAPYLNLLLKLLSEVSNIKFTSAILNYLAHMR